MRTEHEGYMIYGAIIYDFTAFTSFTSFYVGEQNHNWQFFERFLEKLKYGQTQFEFNNDVTFPTLKYFAGKYETSGPDNFKLRAKAFGDTEWVDKDQIQSSTRVFIYSESDLTDEDIITLKQTAKSQGHNLQFRSHKFAKERKERAFTLNMN
jgi:hypothetical protein